jgi:hypothetical protein
MFASADTILIDIKDFMTDLRFAESDERSARVDNKLPKMNKIIATIGRNIISDRVKGSCIAICLGRQEDKQSVNPRKMLVKGTIYELIDQLIFLS